MKLPFSLGVSGVFHVAIVAMSFAWAIDAPVEPEMLGWQDVEIRPVRFETLEMPRLAVAQPDAPPLEVEPPAEPTPDPEPPKKRARPKKKPKKKPPVTPPKPAAQELAPVVVAKTQEAAPKSTAPTAEVVKPKAIEPTFASVGPRPDPKPLQKEAVGGVRDTSTGSPSRTPGALRGVRRGYLRGLYKLVSKHKRYPRIARRGRKQGRVILAVTIDGAGKILEVRVHKGSGHGVLDRSAAETIRALKRFPRPPQALGWSRHTIKVPIHYKLRR